MATYEPLYETPSGTFRWLLNRIEDPRGNAVDYHYWVDGNPALNVYLDRITYNGTEIRFYREERPDTISFATGANLSETRYRLKTVDVKVSGQRVRCYELHYEESDRTSRSLLANVQQFGRDAVLDAEGTVLSGTSLPAMEMEGLIDGDSSFTTPERWVDSYGYSAGGWRTCHHPRMMADVNGDGMQDVVGFANSGVYISSSNSNPDLLTTLQNGIGGTTRIEYTSSSAWNNTSLPTGFIVQTVSSVTTDDGRGNTSTTDYSYEGGLWSHTDQRFLGFRKVTAVLDAQGSYTETFYFQREGSISKPEYTYFRDNQGDIFSYSAYEYTENTQAPYTSLLTSRWDYECNLSLDIEDCRRTLIEFAYDQYGNVVAAYEHGDFDLSGDERTTLRGYVPNERDYIVGLPAYENVYAGIGSDGELLQQSLNFYDNNRNYQQAPHLGNLTELRKWNDQTGGYVSTQMQYDTWGNLIREIDERGNATTVEFDPIYNIYPIVSTNALGHRSTRQWDFILGLETSSTDPNKANLSSSHDALGRVLKNTYPDGSSIRYEYLNWGDPNRQRTRETHIIVHKYHCCIFS